MTYRTKLLVNFTALFVIFAVVLIVFQHHRDVNHREELLSTRLRSYSDLVAGALEQQDADLDSTAMKQLQNMLPPELRLTVVSRDGRVRYDTDEPDLGKVGNHSSRPEVKTAWLKGEGIDIRQSETTHRTYFYFAKSYGDFSIRVALPYDDSVQDFMQPGNVFTGFVLLIFPIVIVLLIYLSDRFGKSVAGLRRFINSADRGLVDYDRITFPNTELGEMGRAIMQKYKELEQSNQIIAVERERLTRHFLYFDGGIAIFSPERRKMLANPSFLQFVNTILDTPTPDIDAIWEAEAFRPARNFLELNQKPTIREKQSEAAPVFRYTIHAGSSIFALQLLIYSEGSFEMTLTDATRAEKNKLLKQQMSNNITHELRTPVSSIRGFVETLLQCDTLSEERRHYFLQRTYAQVVRLSDLIRDVALISKTEEAADTLPREDITLLPLARDVVEELRPSLEAAGMQATIDIPERTTMHGNFSLLYGIFRNLMENSIRYAGHGTTLTLQCYRQEAGTLYFRYFDTGCGVAEEHLPRLFERFYRVSEGRTRDCGGTGLGLSIVRNAVLFHGGTISVRNRKGGGLEFLFTMKK